MIYLKNYSNTEFMSEKEVYAYLVQVSEFLKKYLFDNIVNCGGYHTKIFAKG